MLGDIKCFVGRFNTVSFLIGLYWALIYGLIGLVGVFLVVILQLLLYLYLEYDEQENQASDQ